MENKLKGEIIPLLGDCRELVDSLPKVDRVIMNLPSNSIDFIDIVCKISKPNSLLHFYGFYSKENAQSTSSELLRKKLKENNWQIIDILNFQKIRESAPYEIHACLDVLIAPFST